MCAISPTDFAHDVGLVVSREQLRILDGQIPDVVPLPE
ncbi:hypothetical protein Y013_11475 [Rhodococcus pyridinivorans SB3094]|uniref:Uncharacterized protein n=1 Tax=Rhodococcus pyridinivorans SB3094 TaxID=1435356 RepID=V9XQR9_9NOCA|nr:hypothetical protein Y013_11475 [Rhodococcus pyridinivorans SB3094]